MSRQVFIIICLTLILLASLGFLFPRYHNLRLLKLKIAQKEKQIEVQKDYFSKINQISEALRLHKESALKINSALPDGPQLPSLLDFIQESCSKCGLVLEKINPFVTSQVGKDLVKKGLSEKVKETRISIEVAGSYSSFKDFLSTLEKSTRMIEIESISFSTPDGVFPTTYYLAMKVYSY